MNKLNEIIIKDMFDLKDEKYKQFHSNLCPNTDNIIGVRVPEIRKYVKKIIKEVPNYLDEIKTEKFKYYEEVLIYGLYIVLDKLEQKSFFEKLDIFVPLIDNWAICDIVAGSIKINKTKKNEFYKYIKKYYNSKKEFERRFFVVMLFHFLEDDYINQILSDINNIDTKDYYVSMAIAWLVSGIYIKYKDNCLKFLEDNNLDNKTYNKACQKIIESNRVTKEEKYKKKKMKRR